MVLGKNSENPTKEISLAWTDLGCEINKKNILNDLNGSFEYHTLNGLMGPSGAGKTTFFNVFIRHLTVTSSSQLFLNENSPTLAFVSQHCNETIISKMKIRDILTYAFRFKNGWLSSKKMKQHIQIIIDQLMLDVKILDRKFENCSGGEQKRIAIAQELMSLKQPSFLFIDEPTTGLDSPSAFWVMKCLHELAQHHTMTIIVSIHLPNTDILNLFDKLYILAKGGVCIYSGKPKFLKHNLQNQLRFELSGETPPIEEYLKIACRGIKNRQVQTLFQQTAKQEKQNLEAHLKNLKKFSGLFNKSQQFHWFSLFTKISRLFNLTFWWDLQTLITVIAFYIIFVIIMYTVYGAEIIQPNGCQTISFEQNKTCYKRQNPSESSESWMTYQFMIEMFLSSFSMSLSAYFFLSLLKVFTNEHLNRWYSLSVFYWSINTLHLVESIFYSSILTILVYFTTDMMRLDDDTFNLKRFSHFWFFYWLIFVYMQSFGELSSALLKNIVINGILNQSLIALCLCSGTTLLFTEFMNKEWVTWFTDLFALKYLTRGIIYSNYGISRCDPDKEFSLVLRKYYVDSENVFSNVIQVGINIVVLKVFVFILLYFQFNWSFKNLFQFNIFNLFSTSQNNSNNETLNSVFQKFDRKKSEKEIEFEKFTKNKIHVAWKSLSLFDSESIFENRSIHDKHSSFILRSLNGQFHFGTINALMGTSGSGKTSLLRVLNGQLKTKLSEETNIFLSKYTPTRTCFLTQEVSGHLMPGLTAKQSLIYASKLKNINENEKIDHQKIASNLLAELEIENTAEKMVQRCSGGERKRLALALELTALRMPNLICIDEPTSGLDSNSAEVVIACLSKFVHRHNITIAVSIHQPNAAVMMMFDTLYVLARGGVCIYSGPPNEIKDHLLKVPEIQYPEEFFAVEELIKYSCLNHQQEIVQKLVEENHKKSHEKTLFLDDIVSVLDGIPSNRQRFLFKSVYLLTSRQLVNIRQHSWYIFLFFTLLSAALGIGLRIFFSSSIVYESGCISLEEDFNATCFNDEELTRQLNIYHSYTYLIMFSSVLLFNIWVQYGYMFLIDIVFYYNENHNGWYSSGTFYLAKMICETFFMIFIIIPYIYIIDVYESFKPNFFWIYFGLMLMASISVQGLSHVLVLIVNSKILLIGPLMVLLFYCQLILANIFFSIDRLSIIYQFLANFSIFRFINESSFVYLYGFGRCSSKQISMILYQMNIHHDEYFYYCIQMLLFQVFFFRICAFLMLLYRSNNSNKNPKRELKMIEFHFSNLSQSINSFLPGLSASHQEFRIKQIRV